MKTLLLKPKIESLDSVTIYDEVITGFIDDANLFCVTENGSIYSLKYLAKKFKFPFKQDDMQFEVVDTICQDENLFAMVEFYEYEPHEF